MRTIFTILCLVCLLPTHSHDIGERLRLIDSYLSRQSTYDQQKEDTILALTREVGKVSDAERKLELYNRIYTEYYTYRFDSAMAYVDRGLRLSQQVGSRHYHDLNVIHKAVLLSTSGLYSHALETLQGLDEKQLELSLLYEYYMAYVWIYNYWEEYCGDNAYAQDFTRLRQDYMERLLRLPQRDASWRDYLQGEYYYKQQEHEKAIPCYERSLKNLPVNTRLYAMVTYALAVNYQAVGNQEQYEYYLSLAAISDIVNPLKENLAMQVMAMHLFKNYPDQLERANRYINHAMQDAQFYNNRLRMIEISQKLPTIFTAYQKKISQNNLYLVVALAAIVLLAVVLALAFIMLRKQFRQTARRKAELDMINRQLVEMNGLMADMSRAREGYVGMFLDLCAAYIDRLNRYRETVLRKIKAKAGRRSATNCQQYSPE